jgi:glyoxylase-like metal-dependent hydrolase (beta-lactamase superfamily II)
MKTRRQHIRDWMIAIGTAQLGAGVVSAQDAKSVLTKASQALGSADSVQFSATGTFGSLGQSLTPTSPWPLLKITSYTKTIDYPSQSSKEELTRTQLDPPSKGGGAPFAGEQKQVNLSSGPYAWNQPGAQPQPAVAAADERLLQIYLTPQGFVKGALANNATAKKAKGGTEISFTVNSKWKVSGLIDAQGQVVRAETWLPSPVLGDMLVESDYSDYKDYGGIKFPAHIVQKQGGYPVLDLTVSAVKANVPGAALQAPDAVRTATAPPVRVESSKLADGVWFLGGGTHNSVLVEFKDYVAIVEAPNSEERSLAVIAEVKKLVPGKPIKYLVNTHHHFDHSSGVRTYVAQGTTIITSAGNKAYYEQAWKAPRALAPDQLSQTPKKAVFVEVKDKYELTDGTRSLDLYLTQGDTHNATILFGYLPKEKILIEADDFTPAAPNGPPLVPLALGFGNNLYENIQRLKLDVTTIAPLHGRVVPYAEFPKALGKSTS